VPTETALGRVPHVVHLVSGDQWAGAEVMVANLLTELRVGGRCQPAAVCLNDGALAERLRRAGVEVRVFDERTLSFAAIVKQARAWLSERDVHILHSHRYKEHLLAAMLAPLLRARLVATVHGLPEPARVHRFRYSLQHRASFWLLRHRFDRVVAVSHTLERQLTDDRGLSTRQVLTVPNGIPVPDARVTNRLDDSWHVGSVGRLVPVKGFDVFIRAAARLRAHFPRARFSILGDGPDRAHLEAQVAALGLGEVFTFVTPTQDPWPFYRSLDVYLNTSEAEGLPLSVLEAMAVGLAVVAPAVGGMPEVIEHGRCGWLVGSRDAQDFAAACDTLLSDAGLRAEIGAAAHHRVVRSFSVRRMASDYAQAYEKLCGAGRGVPAVA